MSTRRSGAEALSSPGTGEERNSSTSTPHAQACDHVARLYEEQSGRLLRHLARETGCKDTARDIAQEAFAKFFQMGPARIFGIRSPEAFLRQLASNVLRDRWRARSVSERAADRLDPCEESIDPIAALESRDTLRRLERAIAELKPKTRRIFLAQRIDGLSYAEIAAETGLSVKGVEKQMSKAIAKIDRLLERG